MRWQLVPAHSIEESDYYDRKQQKNALGGIFHWIVDWWVTKKFALKLMLRNTHHTSLWRQLCNILDPEIWPELEAKHRLEHDEQWKTLILDCETILSKRTIGDISELLDKWNELLKDENNKHKSHLFYLRKMALNPHNFYERVVEHIHYGIINKNLPIGLDSMENIKKLYNTSMQCKGGLIWVKDEIQQTKN